MQDMAPLDILYPDSLCFISAHCHAVNSGHKGYTGHVRQSPECKKKEHFAGECCQYGSTTPVDIVLSLLVDEGIPDLGIATFVLVNTKK
jgi:hypothetical protein